MQDALTVLTDLAHAERHHFYPGQALRPRVAQPLEGRATTETLAVPDVPHQRADGPGCSSATIPIDDALALWKPPIDGVGQTVCRMRRVEFGPQTSNAARSAFQLALSSLCR